MRVEQNLHRGMIQLAIDMLGTQLPLKLTDDLFTVEDPNLFDQSIKPEPDRGVADSVFFRDCFQGTRCQDEAFQKALVLIAKPVNPKGSQWFEGQLKETFEK